MFRVLPLLALLSLAFAPAPRMRPSGNELDLKLLQGSWTSARGFEARFERDRLAFYRDGNLISVYRVTLDASSKPASFRLKGIGGDASDGRVYLGIYRIDGSTLTITTNNSGENDQPRAFGDSTTGPFTFVFKRKKP